MITNHTFKVYALGAGVFVDPDTGMPMGSEFIETTVSNTENTLVKYPIRTYFRSGTEQTEILTIVVSRVN